MAKPLELKPDSLQFTHLKSHEYNVTFENIEIDTTNWNWRIQSFTFTIQLDENVGTILGEIAYTGSKGSYPYFTLYNVREFEIDYALKVKVQETQYTFSEAQDVSGKSIVEECDYGEDGSDPYVTSFIKETVFESKRWKMKGTLKFRFILSETVNLKDDPVYLMKQNAFEYLKKETNFIIKCGDEKFHFNKILLSCISDVFKNMIEGGFGQEAQSGLVDIKDFSPETIKVFQKIAFENKAFDPEDPIIDLLMYANKYFMIPLKKKCIKHLIANLTPENIYDVIKTADQINDDNFLKYCAKFLAKNNDKEQWIAFQKSHPACSMKVTNFMLFD